jgi:hypothetical protein
VVESLPVFICGSRAAFQKSATNIVAAMLEFLARQLASRKAVPFWKNDGLR